MVVIELDELPSVIGNEDNENGIVRELLFATCSLKFELEIYCAFEYEQDEY